MVGTGSAPVTVELGRIVSDWVDTGSSMQDDAPNAAMAAMIGAAACRRATSGMEDTYPYDERAPVTIGSRSSREPN